MKYESTLKSHCAIPFFQIYDLKYFLSFFHNNTSQTKTCIIKDQLCGWYCGLVKNTKFNKILNFLTYYARRDLYKVKPVNQTFTIQSDKCFSYRFWSLLIHCEALKEIKITNQSNVELFTYPKGFFDKVEISLKISLLNKQALHKNKQCPLGEEQRIKQNQKVHIDQQIH